MFVVLTLRTRYLPDAPNITFLLARAYRRERCTDVCMSRASLPPAPARIARLPLSRSGFPIIAVVQRNGTGHADFAAVSDIRKIVLGVFELCGICGLPLHGERVTPWPSKVTQLENPLSLEPPVHEVCASYAVQVCPYLLHPSAVIHRGPAAGRPSLNMQLARHAASTGITHINHGVGFGVSLPLTGFSFDDAVQRYEALLAADTTEPVPSSFAPVLEMLEQPDPITTLALAALHVSCMSPLMQLSANDEQARALARATVAGERRTGPELAAALCAVEHWLDDCGGQLPYIVSDSRSRLNEVTASGRAPQPARRAAGRNEPCPCGSGWKYKRCHGNHT